MYLDINKVYVAWNHSRTLRNNSLTHEGFRPTKWRGLNHESEVWRGNMARTSILFRYDVPINSTWQGLPFVRCLDIDSSLHRQDGWLTALYVYIIQVSLCAVSPPRADVFSHKGFSLCNCHPRKANFLFSRFCLVHLGPYQPNTLILFNSEIDFVDFNDYF